MTAYITYRVNPNKSSPYAPCCICCNDITGIYIYYYDRGDRHYTCVCDDCIKNLRKGAIDAYYVVKESYSKYAPTAYSPRVIVDKMRNHGGPKPCSSCSQNMINYIYSVETPNTHHKNICADCTESLKYNARTKGYLINVYNVESTTSSVSDTPKKIYPQEHSTSWQVVCSKCFSHTFRYKSWSYGNITGLCESCAHNM
jgi:hypothetical protein